MSREVTFDIHGAGNGDLPKAIEAVSASGVEITRAASVVIPVRKAHLTVSGSDPEVDTAYEAVVAAFPGSTVRVREKEFPFHWEKRG